MENTNRIKAEWEKWQELEKGLERLVPGSLKNNRPFLKDTLAFYTELEVKYSGTLSRDERVSLRALTVRKNEFAKVLYPNPIIRFARKVFLPIKRQLAINHFQKNTAANEQIMTGILMRSGFGEVNNQVIGQMRQGRDAFSVPVSTYIGEKERIDYTLSFVKNQQDQYVLDHYRASYTNGTEKRIHNFHPDQNISANQAYHLMAGRALINDDPDVPWKTEQWLQLDFNDKDALGNYRTKVLNKDESYDLEGTLLKAGIKDNLLRITQNLRNGEQIEVSLKGNKYLLEANPHHKTLNVYDTLGNRHNIEQILSNEKQKAKVIALHPQAPSTKQTKHRGVKH